MASAPNFINGALAMPDDALGTPAQYRSLNGVWQVSADGGTTWTDTGGAGAIASLASADGTVVITDPAGPIPDLSVPDNCVFNSPVPAAVRVVRLASTANLGTLSGVQTVDGTATVNGDRVLLAWQTTASQNGIYVTAAGAWSRATDMDATGEVEAGTAIFVTSGVQNRYATFRITNLGAIEPGVTSLVIKPVSLDFDPNVGNPGTRAQIGVQALWVFVNGTSSGNPAYLAGFTTTTARFESLADGILMGGPGYKALAATTAWMALHGGQGKPTGVPANLNPGGFPGAVAMRWDVTNKKFYGFDTETVPGASWKCYGAAYSAKVRGTDLTDADQNLAPGTDKISEYVQNTALTANRTKELQDADGILGQTVDVVRTDTAAFTLEIEADDDSTLFTFPASPTKPIRARFRFTTVWTFVGFEYTEA